MSAQDEGEGMGVRVQVSVRPTGERNPHSNGAEVWVLHTSGASDRAAVDAFGEAPGWLVRDGALIATGAADSIHLEARLDEVNSIVLVSHPWSGKVEISTGGKTELIDLYSTDSTTRVVRLTHSSGYEVPPPQGPAAAEPLFQPQPATAKTMPPINVGAAAARAASRMPSAPARGRPGAIWWILIGVVLLAGCAALLAWWYLRM